MRIVHLTQVLAAFGGLAVATPANADDAGSYLAARAAMIASDYAEASQYYARVQVHSVPRAARDRQVLKETQA